MANEEQRFPLRLALDERFDIDDREVVDQQTGTRWLFIDHKWKEIPVGR